MVGVPRVPIRRVLLPLAAVIIASLILAGCGTARTRITFVFLTGNATAAGPYWKEVETAFEQANPDLDVDIQIYDFTVGRATINQMIAAGKPPQLAKISTRWLQEYVFAGLVEPVDEFMSADFRAQFYALLLDQGAQYQGKTFGVPIAFTTRALYYNKDLFAQAKIEKAPETWAELADAAVKIGALPGNDCGFGLQGDPKHIETSTYFYYFVWGNDGDALTPDGTRAAFNNQQGLEALKFLQNLIASGGTQADPTLDNRPALETKFVNGECAMVITFNGLASRLSREAPNLNYGIAPIPYNKEPVSLAVTDSLVMFQQADHKQEAWKFVEFMYQDDWRLKDFEWEGVLPEKSTVAALPEVADNNTLDTFLELVPYARFEPQSPKSTDIANVVGAELALVYSGQKEPEAALNDAAAKVNELLAYAASSW